MKTQETMLIYFELLVEPEMMVGDMSTSEKEAYAEIWKLLKPCSISRNLVNEGHDEWDSLVCCFVIETKNLRKLYDCIVCNRGGGDDIIFLDNGFQAQGFKIVDYNVFETILFEDWDDLL